MPSELRPVSTPTTIGTFVNKTPAGEPKAGPDPKVELGDIMPIASYEGEKGYPYATEYYQLNTPYEFLDTPIRNDIEAIDNFVKSYIKDEAKEDTVMSYAKTLKALEKKIGIDDNTMRTEAVRKVAALARNFAKVYDAYGKNVRRKVLSKLIAMTHEGQSSFDQTDYILQQIGGLIK